MAKKVNEFSILQPLAKELGYKNADELKEALGKEEVGRGTKGAMGNIGGAGGAGTGFLGGREIGSGFGVGIKKRLAGGQGIGQAVSGGFGEFKETLSFGNIKKRALEKTFGGPGFLSSYARGQLRKKYAGEKSPTKDGSEEKTEGKGQAGGDSSSYFNLLAKSSMVLPGMARDTNVLRQNLQKLVKIFAGPQEKGKKAYATKSDASSQVLNASQKERKKDEDFFAAEDKKESELEAGRMKDGVSPTPEKEETEESFIDKIFKVIGKILEFIFSVVLLNAISKIFNPKTILKFLGKVFVIGTLVVSLFKGITAAWDKWKESGSIKEALISGLGAIVDFLTLGYFGEDSIRKMFDGISSFFEPLIDGVKGIYYTVKDWIANNVGIPKIPLGKWLGKERFIGPYYPFKSNPYSEANEISERPLKAKEDKKLQESEAAAPSGSGPSPTAGGESSSPTPDAGNQPKALMTTTGESIKMPSGALFDNESKSLIYKGVSIPASKIESQAEMDKIVQAIDNKAVVEYQGKDASGSPVTKTINGATGEISVAPPKEPPTPVTPPAAAPSGGSGGGEVSAASGGGGGGGNMSAGGGGGKVSAGSGGAASSGSDISNASSDVAEAQRMESAADTGTSVDASSTNNTSGSTGKQQTKIADVYDTEFANLYSMA